MSIVRNLPGQGLKDEGEARAPATKGVTNGDSHDHDGGDGATVPIAGGGTGATTAAAARTALGGMAAPAAPFDADEGAVVITGGVSVGGLYDPCTSNPVDPMWTTIQGNVVGDGSKYIFTHAYGADWPELIRNLPVARSAAMWFHCKFTTYTDNGLVVGGFWADPERSLIMSRYEVGQGGWVLGLSTLTSNTYAAVNDAEGWCGIVREEASGYLTGWWSNNAHTVNPGRPGSSGWIRHGTVKQETGTQRLIAPIAKIRVHTIIAGTEVVEVRHITVAF